MKSSYVLIQFFVGSFLIYPVLTSTKICPRNYIRRTSHDSTEYCCKKVENNCPAGTFVRKCSNNLGKDICKPCPDDTWIADETNSDYPFQCEEYSCHYGAKRVNYLSTSGCSLPCVCDTTNNFYGLDNCNCKVFSGKCKHGTTLSINGSCLSVRIAEEIYTVKLEEPVYIPIQEITDNHEENKKTAINGNVPNIDISRTTITKVSSWGNKTDTETKEIVDNTINSKILITIIVCSATLGLFLLAFFGVRQFRRKKGMIRESSSSKESPNSQDDEDITDVKITDCTYVKSTDSGISLLTTSSQDPTEKRVQDESPLSSITPFRDKQVAFVSPILQNHADHNQTTVPLLATDSNETPFMALSTSSMDYIIQQRPEL
ncbi:uncharacterized protein LOC127719891 isoform X1 [Mytilus californianus]|uniref:uncharacterized protein LOC127719891 isoform X1 n=1 Tax=Mytilus californianus TaxID=6549 RepID=UPI0022467F28|nr:uncharacterized protein LOC127719891 isoform X1 [Mytilus californianus]